MKFLEALKKLRKNDIQCEGKDGYLTLEKNCDVVQVYSNGSKRTIGTLYDFEKAKYIVLPHIPENKKVQNGTE